MFKAAMKAGLITKHIEKEHLGFDRQAWEHMGTAIMDVDRTCSIIFEKISFSFLQGQQAVIS